MVWTSQYELLFNYPDWNQRLNIAISSYKYGDSHHKDKTVPWWSSYLNNDNSIVGKTAFWHGSGILPEIPSVSESIYEFCHMHPLDNSRFLCDFHALCCRSHGALHAGKFGHRIGMQVIVFCWNPLIRQEIYFRMDALFLFVEKRYDMNRRMVTTANSPMGFWCPQHFSS